MPTLKYWDFRDILGVDPERDKRCVAVAARTGQRCKISGTTGFASLQVNKAGRLLDRMDKTANLDECREFLIELASYLTCAYPHRKMDAVLESCCERWEEAIDAYEHDLVETDDELEVQDVVGDVAAPVDEEAYIEERGIEGGEEVNLNTRTDISPDLVEVQTLGDSTALVGEDEEWDTQTENSFFNHNEILPRPPHELEGGADENSGSGSVDEASASQNLEMSLVETHESLVPTTFATHLDGLPSPPKSPLMALEAAEQDYARVQSPPQTPTRALVLVNDTEPELLSLESPLGEVEAVHNTIEENSYEPPGTPVRSRDYSADALPTPEATPEPLRVREAPDLPTPGGFYGEQLALTRVPLQDESEELDEQTPEPSQESLVIPTIEEEEDTSPEATETSGLDTLYINAGEDEEREEPAPSPCEAEPDLPTPPSEAPLINIDSDINHETEPAAPTEEAQAPLPTTSPPLQREESFGHVDIDPFQRRYRTRLSEPPQGQGQEQSQSQETDATEQHSRLDAELFAAPSDISLDVDAFTERTMKDIRDTEEGDMLETRGGKGVDGGRWKRVRNKVSDVVQKIGGRRSESPRV